MRDRIEIHDLEVTTRIGVTGEERATPQKLLVDIAMMTDTRPAALSDDLEDTIDYQELSDEVRSFAGTVEFNLVESFAEGIARICIEDHSAPSVAINVKKPKALSAARTIIVAIQRDSEDYPST